jgi:hypothetical protein
MIKSGKYMEVSQVRIALQEDYPHMEDQDIGRAILTSSPP